MLAFLSAIALTVIGVVTISRLESSLRVLCHVYDLYYGDAILYAMLLLGGNDKENEM